MAYFYATANNVNIIGEESKLPLGVSIEESRIEKEEKEVFCEFLREHGEVFATDYKVPGQTNATIHSINTKDHPPIHSNPYRSEPC